MTRLHMHAPDDDAPSIEARLDKIAIRKPPPHLRRRVLAVIDTVLAEPPADEITAGAEWSLLGTAAAAALLVASWGGSLGLGRSVADAAAGQPISLTERMAAAGIPLEPLSQPPTDPRSSR
jgi:hypothetical protein